MSELRERTILTLTEQGVDDLHSWRCKHPEIYGRCTCVEDMADALVALIREAQAEALEEFANEHEALSNDALRDLGDELPSYRAGCTDAAASAVARLRARAAAYRAGEGS